MGGRFHGARHVHLGWVGIEGLPGALPSYEGAVLEDVEQTMEAWTAIFRHLQEVGNRGEEEGQDDPGLRRFATAMKTPPGRVNTDLLNPPKRLRMTEEGDDESVITTGTAWDARTSHLKLTHSLALVKGELGSRDDDASYVMVHGGLQGSWDKLRALERAVAQDRLGLASKADDSKVGLILTQATAHFPRVGIGRHMDNSQK